MAGAHSLNFQPGKTDSQIDGLLQVLQLSDEEAEGLIHKMLPNSFNFDIFDSQIFEMLFVLEKQNSHVDNCLFFSLLYAIDVV